jgi:hypothetical protein
MSVGPVRSTPSVPLAPSAAPPPAEVPVAAVPTDRVSISPAAARPAGGDADHDGDSR